jgi:hypothetical protein
MYTLVVRVSLPDVTLLSSEENWAPGYVQKYPQYNVVMSWRELGRPFFLRVFFNASILLLDFV